MKSKSSRNRRLSLEGLESRCVLDGNVSAVVVNGVLQIYGDALGNDVQIRRVAQTYSGEWPGAKYEITGLSRYNNTQTTTTINGQTSAIVEGVKNGMLIGLGHGNNSLRISNPGSDPSIQNPAAVPGQLTVNTGSGADLIRLYVQNGKEVVINSGGGSDRIDISKSTLNKLTINADWADQAAAPRAGADEVVIGASAINGAANVYMGPQLANSGDTFRVTYGSDFGAGLSLDGVDSAVHWWPTTAGSQVKGPVDILAETISMEHVDIDGSLTIKGGDGITFVPLSDISVTGQLSVLGKGGDDVFNLGDVVAATTILDGDGGDDTFRDFGGNDLGDLTLISIEHQETG